MVDFPGKRPKEEILLKIEKHWIIKFKIILWFVLLAAIPLSTFWGFFLLGSMDLTGNGLRFAIIFSVFYGLFFILNTSLRWFDEMIDMILITSERIIDITQENMFTRHVTQAELQHIQDSRGEEKGFFQSILHYGSIHIQTASGDNVFHIDNIADPVHRAEQINAIKKNYLEKYHDNYVSDAGHLDEQGLSAPPHAISSKHA